MELCRCNLCGEDRTKLLFRRKDARFLVSDQEFDVVRCRRCSLVYVNPRPTELAIQEYCTAEFYEAHLSAEEALRVNRSRLDAMYRHVRDVPVGRVLDVGCYKGEFLYVLKQRGWSVAGVEFQTRPPNLFGVDIYYGPLETAPFEEHSFDLVTMWAVLEHVYDPKQVLHQVHRFLKPAGRLVLLVPNFNSIPARYMRHDDVPRHITMFTRRTLYRMLGSTGYRPIYVECGQDVYGGSVRGLLNYVVKRLAGETMAEIVAQNRGPDRWYEFSRQIHGRDSRLMERVDLWDQALAPKLDALLDWLGLGFIMTVKAVPNIL